MNYSEYIREVMSGMGINSIIEVSLRGVAVASARMTINKFKGDMKVVAVVNNKGGLSLWRVH